MLVIAVCRLAGHFFETVFPGNDYTYIIQLRKYTSNPYFSPLGLRRQRLLAERAYRTRPRTYACTVASIGVEATVPELRPEYQEGLLDLKGSTRGYSYSSIWGVALFSRTAQQCRKGTTPPKINNFIGRHSTLPASVSVQA